MRPLQLHKLIACLQPCWSVLQVAAWLIDTETNSVSQGWEPSLQQGLGPPFEKGKGAMLQLLYTDFSALSADNPSTILLQLQVHSMLHPYVMLHRDGS